MGALLPALGLGGGTTAGAGAGAGAGASAGAGAGAGAGATTAGAGAGAAGAGGLAAGTGAATVPLHATAATSAAALSPLAQVGHTLLTSLQNVGQSLMGPPSTMVGPPSGTGFQNFLGGLSHGATGGLAGQALPGFGNFAGQQFGSLLQSGMHGQPQQVQQAQVYPLRRYM